MGTGMAVLGHGGAAHRPLGGLQTLASFRLDRPPGKTYITIKRGRK